MTGYGRATLRDNGRVTAEIRAVNGRFLKLSVKLPGRYGALEDRVKRLLDEHGVKRGTVEVSVFFDGAGTEEGAYGLNPAAITHYLKQVRALAKQHKLQEDVGLSALLPLPGVVTREEPEQDLDRVWARVRKALLAALQDFDRMREHEGAASVADIRAQLAQLARHRAQIEALAPEMPHNAIRKFKDRVARLIEKSGVAVPLSPDALEREVVLMADRMDISEELARLQSHLQQMDAALAAGGETGKQLDFLTQEVLRETNTIGSKAQDERITYHIVAMKGLVEKIREQVQNLE
ncbi:MAG: YicC family protein [Planctomycetota bacterium]|nr:YicC family protein [Planctomycetota bacterium]